MHLPNASTVHGKLDGAPLDKIDALKRTITQMEMSKPNRVTVPLGVKALDDVLAGGLEHSVMHEIGGPAAHLFACLWLQRIKGPIVWVSLKNSALLPFMPGLGHMGVDPARLLSVHLNTVDDALSAAHQALSDHNVGCVVLDMDKSVDLSQARQFQLAAQAGHTVGLVLDQRGILPPYTDTEPLISSAMTRWHVMVMRQHNQDVFLHAELCKNRRGQEKTFHLRLTDRDLDYAAYDVCLAAAS